MKYKEALFVQNNLIKIKNIMFFYILRYSEDQRRT